MEKNVKICRGDTANVSHLPTDYQEKFKDYPHSCGMSVNGYCSTQIKPDLCPLSANEYGALPQTSLTKVLKELANR